MIKKEKLDMHQQKKNWIIYLMMSGLCHRHCKLQHKQGLRKMTIGSDALFDYKTRVGKKFKKVVP